eukprot:Colp12_sorted_trinity150504_noHs@14433
MDTSVHTANIEEIYDMPIDAIIRPIPSILCEKKVEGLIETISDEGKRIQEVPPIDVLWVKGSEGGDYYFAFGGCHRFAAHQRLGSKTIRVKLVPASESDLRVYMGSSTPKLR